MLVQIELNDRLYNDIVHKAEMETVDVLSYIAQLVEEKFYIDKYGDLNELIGNKNKSVETKPMQNIEDAEKKDEEKPIEVKVPKKRGRKPKSEKVAETIDTAVIVDTPKEKEILKTEEQKPIETITTDDILKKVVKRTRILKSK